MKDNSVKIIQLSVVHFPYDPRVVYREAFSLAKKYQVYLLIPKSDASLHAGIRFVKMPYFAKLWQRILFAHPVALLKCLLIRPAIVHFHDSELLPIALILRVFGIKIIYDVHENVRKQWSVKLFNNASIFRFFFSFFDRLAQRYFYIILAEKSYQATYQHLAEPHEVVLNYPDLAFFEPFYQARQQQKMAVLRNIFYIGQISFARGIDTLIKALAKLLPHFPDLKVHLVGGFEFDISSETDLHRIEEYKQVKNNLVFHGKIDAHQGLHFAENAFVGIALLKPVGDFVESYPTKIFEYMALGLPIITSDFELYRPIVEANQCGFCLNPTDVEGLANAIEWLIEYPQEAQQMGKNSRKAAEEKYNWKSEEEKLFSLYEKVLKV